MPEENTPQETASAPASVEPAQEPVAPVETSVPAPVEESAPKTASAQIPESEPMPTEPEPSDSAQDKLIAHQSPPPPTSASTLSGGDLLMKARATIQNRKRKKLERILEALTAKDKITNDEVEKLLHVSDATATRYLATLEKEGKIQQVGKTGRSVAYTRI